MPLIELLKSLSLLSQFAYNSFIEVVMVHGLLYEYLTEGIHVYKFTDLHRQTIDIWADLGRQHDLEALAAGKHIRSIHDFRGHWVTPYLLAKSLEVAALNDSLLRESVAVLGNQTASAFFQSAIRHFPSESLPNIRFFSREEAAFTWLRRRVEQFGE